METNICPVCLEDFDDESTDPAEGRVDFTDAGGTERSAHWSCGVEEGWNVIHPTPVSLDDDVKIKILTKRIRQLKEKVADLDDEATRLRCDVGGLEFQLYG